MMTRHVSPTAQGSARGYRTGDRSSNTCKSGKHGLGLGSTALFRFISLGAGFVVNMFAVGALARQFGAAEYGLYALIASLIFLLPFADLGLGAGVVNATADHHVGVLDDNDYRLILSKTRDVLLLLTLAILAASVVLLVSGVWPWVLGVTNQPSVAALAATYTMACVAVVLPLGLGARMLQGRGRMQRVVQFSLVGPLTTGLVIGSCILMDAAAVYYVCAPGTAYLVVGFLTFARARATCPVRMLPPFATFHAVDRPVLGLSRTALPFFLITLGLAVGVQSQRLVLSHVGTIQQVAEYSFVAQFTGPMISILTVTGQNLWPRYRSQLASGFLTARQFRRHLLVFGACGALASFGLILGVPLLGHLVLAGEIRLPATLLVAAGCYLLVMGIHQPSAMLLTDQRGLWWQALLVGVTALASIAAAAALIEHYGSAAIYLALTACMLVLQVVPTMALALVRIRRCNRMPIAGATVSVAGAYEGVPKC